MMDEALQDKQRVIEQLKSQLQSEFTKEAVVKFGNLRTDMVSRSSGTANITLEQQQQNESAAEIAGLR